MADRRVTQTRKGEDGDITALCNPGEWWSPGAVSGAIQESEDGDHTHYVLTSLGERADIHVVDDPTGTYLRTDPDQPEGDNLDDLPDC